MSRARGQRRCVDQGRGHAGAHGATGVTLIRVAATLAPLALSIRARRARGAHRPGAGHDGSQGRAHLERWRRSRWMRTPSATACHPR